MATISLNVMYRMGEPLAAYSYLATSPGQKAARSEEMAPEIVVDFDESGQPIGVELVSPDVTDVEEILAVFDRLGLSRPELRDLAPLRAA